MRLEPKVCAVFLVYILRCSDESLYVGHCASLENRVAVHNAGQGAAWTAIRGPVVLAYSESHQTEAAAIKRELQIKRWSRAKKNALISSDLKRLKELSVRHVRPKPRRSE